MLNGLDYITRSWKALFAGLEDELNHYNVVDHQSVDLIETLAPSASHSDADLIKELVRSRKVFPAIKAEAKRSILLRNLLNTPSLIPSLFTFFETLKHLEPCAKILQDLLPPKQKRSIYEAFFDEYKAPDQVHIEYSQRDVRVQTDVPQHRIRQISYQQLWLYALRNFPSMTNCGPRKDPLKPKPDTAVSNPLAKQEFARLAVLLGFKTEKAVKNAAADAEVELAKDVLNRGGMYQTTDQDVQRLASTLKLVAKKRPSTGIAEFYSDSHIPKERRCGRPFEADYDNDRGSLYLPSISRVPSGQGQCITTFYCTWAMFRTFFKCEVSAATNGLPR